MKDKRAGKRGARAGGKSSRWWAPWALAGAALVGVGVYAAASGGSSRHPEPRPGVSAADVEPSSHYAHDPTIARAYRAAARAAHVIDGIYCYCDCEKLKGHRSLLDCFRDDHGANCGTCQTEAIMAYEMTQEGKSLDEIRAAIDATFGI